MHLKWVWQLLILQKKTVIDDDGSFAFTNLMSNEYFIYSQFAMYEHHHEHVVVARSNNYRGKRLSRLT